jgi:hypothetical protein
MKLPEQKVHIFPQSIITKISQPVAVMLLKPQKLITSSVSLFRWDLFTYDVGTWHWVFMDHSCIMHLTPVMLYYVYLQLFLAHLVLWFYSQSNCNSLIIFSHVHLILYK